MSQLLDRAPYGPRDEAQLLQELNALTWHHRRGCSTYERIWPSWQTARRLEDVPFLHAGLFEHVDFRNTMTETTFERVLKSSATKTGNSSHIPLDAKSSQLQSRSTTAILKDFLGSVPRPLLILDSSSSLQSRGEVPARIAAALSLRPIASEVHFLLDEVDNPASLNWRRLQSVLERHDDVLVYGFTWMLWMTWGSVVNEEMLRRAFADKRVHFVHSGGWKKLEGLRVSREQLDAILLDGLEPGSMVLDFYGMVEQVGIVYPLCESGSRHVPIWAGILVRDPFTLATVEHGQSGMLQLANTLAWGAPYHSVLTEDLGRILPGACACGRWGPCFELIGRLPKADVRGCANV